MEIQGHTNLFYWFWKKSVRIPIKLPFDVKISIRTPYLCHDTELKTEGFGNVDFWFQRDLKILPSGNGYNLTGYVAYKCQ